MRMTQAMAAPANSNVSETANGISANPTSTPVSEPLTAQAIPTSPPKAETIKTPAN